MIMKIYISGSMQGQSDHGFEQFNNAAKQLREKFPNFEIINPAELPRPIDYSGSPWAKCLKRDIKELMNCDYLILLEGWELSPGASLEKHIANLLGIITVCFGNFISTEQSDIWQDIEKSKSLDFNLLYRQITQWQEKTFGKREQPHPPIHHLEKEVKELIENPYDILEYADCFFLLFNAAHIVGFTPEQLLEGIKEKFEINKKRKWGKPDNQGVVLHVKE